MIVAIAALSLAGCSAPAAVDPDIQAKADAFSARVNSEMQTSAEAEADAKVVKVVRLPDRPLRVMFAGDHLTSGYFASVQSHGFSQLVGMTLAQGGPVEEVRGPNDESRVDTLGGFPEVPTNLDMAILQLGTLEAGEGMDTVAFSTAYGAALRTLKENSPNVGIACLSVWQSTGANAGAYDRIIQEQCQSAGGQFVSVASVFSQTNNRGPEGLPTWAGAADAFYPNDAGHRAIAELILERLRVT